LKQAVGHIFKTDIAVSCPDDDAEAIIARIADAFGRIANAVEKTCDATVELEIGLRDAKTGIPALNLTGALPQIESSVSQFVNVELATAVDRAWREGEVPQISPFTLSMAWMKEWDDHLVNLCGRVTAFASRLTQDWSEVQRTFNWKMPAMDCPQLNTGDVCRDPLTVPFSQGPFVETLQPLACLRPRAVGAQERAAQKVIGMVESFARHVCHALNNAKAQREPLIMEANELVREVLEAIDQVLGLCLNPRTEDSRQVEDAIGAMLDRIERTVLDHSAFRADAQAKMARLQANLQQVQGELQKLREGRLAELKYIRGRTRAKIENLKALHQAEIDALVNVFSPS
jgi:hypothetical protein